MTNASKAKGDAFEWDTIKVANDPEGVLAEVGLIVERTRAGYQRDEGDLLVLTPDRQRLATLQLKNRRERKWSEWLADTERQGITARARYAALVVKRNGIADVGRSYTITTVHAHLRLLADLHEAQTRARVAEETLAALRERGIEIPTLGQRSTSARPDLVIATLDDPEPAEAPAPRRRPFGPHGLNGDREQVPS